MKRYKVIQFIILVIGLFAVLASASAANWPNWRNNASNSGMSSESLSALVERWHSTAPIVEENGVVVAGGIAYMSSDDGYLYAFQVATGFNVTGFPVVTAANYGTPAVDSANGKVYVLAGGYLFAYNLDGTSAWTRNVGFVGYNYNAGPVIDGGYVYFNAGGNLQKWSAAGVLQWSSPAGGGNTQPTILGDYVYSNTEVGQIQKFSKATGTQVIGGGFPIATGSIQSAVTAVNGKIFLKAAVLYAYNADTGALLWSQPAGGNSLYYGSPAVGGGVVYVYGYTDSMMYAFDENTGATMAGFPSVALNPGGDRNWASPAIAGGKIYIGAGTSQRLKVLGAAGTAQAGQVLEDHLTFSADPQGFDLCSPVVSDGWVFAVLDGGGLYAFYGGGGPPPQGALTINNGAACTSSPNVTLSISNNGNPNVNEMRISEDPFFTGVPWIPYAPSISFTLSAGFGTKTVYAQLRDTNGQLSNVFTDQIDYLATCMRVCDIDRDGDIDKNDLALISRARGQRAVLNDPRDSDGDGWITPNDVKVCTQRCTRLYCAVQ
jgi:outer membrane protein assembly factor BamB